MSYGVECLFSQSCKTSLLKLETKIVFLSEMIYYTVNLVKL